jgi:CheY-like chemotaxis protein
MKLLIIEDEPEMRRMLARFVEVTAGRLNVDVDALQASNLPEALELLPRAEVILCDGNFPTKPGIVGFGQKPWLAVYAFARPAVDLRLKRFALMTGDEEAALEAEQRFGLPVFRKPFRVEPVMEWIFGDRAIEPSSHRAIDAQELDLFGDGQAA